jgi:predicted membrane-bound mannosyltransferase
VPRTIEGGLLRPAGLTLIAAIFAVEYIFMDALSGQYFAIDFSVGEPAILIVAFAATAIALVVFDRLMAAQKAEQAGRHLPAEH